MHHRCRVLRLQLKTHILTQEAYTLIWLTLAGPTHDDVTFEGIAQAFECKLQLCTEMCSVLQRLIGPTAKLEEAHIKLATLPAAAVLVRSTPDAYPVARVENVYILPGSPTLLQQQFNQFRGIFKGEKRCHSAVRVGVAEVDLVPTLNSIVSAYPTVEVGSYPQDDCSTLVTFDGACNTALRSAVAELNGAVAHLECATHRATRTSAVSEARDKQRSLVSRL
jgi:molybdopterin-biosynthesis enzyme MoeA-like protein